MQVEKKLQYYYGGNAPRILVLDIKWLSHIYLYGLQSCSVYFGKRESPLMQTSVVWSVVNLFPNEVAR